VLALLTTTQMVSIKMKIKSANVRVVFFVASWVISASLFAAESVTIDPATTVFLIRHAEKELGDMKDPPLTEQGRLRAKNWATFFTNVELDKVYSTDTKRTRDTAKVVADSQGQKIVLYDAGAVVGEAFLKENFGKSVLVVGHSNTIPEFTNVLIGAQGYKDLDESQYSKVIVVDVVGASKRAKMLTVELIKPLNATSEK